MSNRMLKTCGHRGMVSKVFDYLMDGHKLSAVDAFALWNEMNVRNKICILRSDGWPIRSEEKPSEKGGSYKVYFMDMDKSLWPSTKESA